MFHQMIASRNNTIAYLYNIGYTSTEIAVIFGISRSTAIQIARRINKGQ